MPLRKSTSKGRPCVKYGESGKCYPYKAGNAASQKAAKKKAINQGLAISRRSGRKFTP